MNQRNKGNGERRRYPKSTIGTIIVSNGRTSSHSSPRNSPRDSPRNSPRASPSLRSVIGRPDETTEKEAKPENSRKRKNNETKNTRPRKKDEKVKTSSKSKSRPEKGPNHKNDHLREIRREVNLDTPSISRSPLAPISTAEEHHTDNESDDNQSGVGFAGHHSKVNFHQLAEQNQIKVPSYAHLAPSSAIDPGSSSVDSDQRTIDETINSISEELSKQEKLVSDILTEQSSDTLSHIDPDDLDTDEMHYLSLQFLNNYSNGNREWCEEFPEHGLPCRKCGLKGHTVIQCTNPAQERCIFCGQYNHRHFTCPDSEELEYKQYRMINCCYCKQPNHLGRNCPDHWRQFHRTTSSQFSPYNNTPNPKIPSCYNCAGPHWGHECRNVRLTSHGPVLAPFVKKRLTEHQSQIFDELNTKINRESKKSSMTKKRKRQ